MYTTRLYASLGIAGQERLITAWTRFRRLIREGVLYRKYQRQLDQTQWLDEAALAAYQEDAVAAALSYARRYVPHYRKSLSDRQTRQVFSWLETLPVIDKAWVRQHEGSLRSRLPTLSVSGGTSGSTGSPLMVRHDLASVIREQAFVDRQRAWASYRAGERRAWWRGDLIAPVARTDPPYWRLNKGENMLMLSSYHLSERTLQLYREALERFDPVIIEAYPSSVAYLAQYLKATGQQYGGKSLRAVLTSSETLSTEQRNVIEAVMGCRVFNWYGGYERVAAIGTCEHGRLHLLGDYSYVELAEVDGDLQEIIGTAFHERAMPLFRYRTGDTVEVATTGASRCPCGRAFPVIKSVVGREDDYVVTDDGRHVGRLDHIYKGIEGVAEAQIRQSASGEIVIAVVPLKSFNEGVRARLMDNAVERLGPGTPIRVETATRLPRTSNGKLRGVIREVRQETPSLAN